MSTNTVTPRLKLSNEIKTPRVRYIRVGNTCTITQIVTGGDDKTRDEITELPQDTRK